MRITAGVEMLEITATIMGRAQTICPVLFWDDDGALLVDAGYPGQLPLLRSAMEQAGVPFEQLQQIILTHQDLDHMGGLAGILSASAHPIEVLAGAGEQPYIQGEKRPVKLTPESVAQAVDSLPASVPEETRRAFRAVLENPPRATVDRALHDGDRVPRAGGLTVIDTPGHTPGHICLYHAASKTLVAGDALRVKDGLLAGPNPRLTHDMDQALRSLRRLAPYDVETVICYHGGLYRGDANRQIADLAQASRP